VRALPHTPDGPAPDLYYVGNKVDLPHDDAGAEAARESAGAVGAAYFATFAKSGEQIEALFQAIAASLPARKRHESTIELAHLEKKRPDGSGPCC
jgi:50S ribosomal subunit-associated GTPase HflX